MHDVETQPALRKGNQEHIKLKTASTKEEINQVLNFQRTMPIITANDVMKHRLSNENPLLDNIDNCWENIGKVFKEYSTIESDYITERLSNKLKKKITFDISKSKSTCPGQKVIHVEGVATKIKYGDLVTACQAIAKLGVPNKASQNLVAQIIEKRISQLF